MATYRWYKKLWNTITGKGERNRQAAEYDQLSKVVDLNQRPLTDQEEARMRTYQEQNPDLAPSQDRLDIMAAARQGDYSQYAQLKPMDKYMLHIEQRHEWHQKVIQARQALGPTSTFDAKAIAAYLVTGSGSVDLSVALNPVYRKGMAITRTEYPSRENEFFDALDRELTQQVTLASFSVNRDTVAQEYTADASGKSPLQKKEAQEEQNSSGLARAIGQWQNHPKDAATAMARHESQCKAMLKMYLLSQLGDLSLPNPPARAGDCTNSISDMFGYGGRVAFVFPEAESGQENFAFESIFTPDGKTTADVGMFSRAATHGIQRPSRGGSSSLEGYQELKGFSLNVTNPIRGVRNYGMDLAVGGLGATGLRGPDGDRSIMNDGRCGHLYVGSCAQTRSGRQAMLVGLESDAPYRANQTGHMHVMSAVAEENASAGGMRTNMVGQKYGGRVVDLSATDPAHIQAVCAAVDNMSMEQMHQVASQVLGKPMSDADMKQLLTSDAFQYGPDVTPERAQQMADDMLSARQVAKGARHNDRTLQEERTVQQAEQQARQQERALREERRLINVRILGSLTDEDYAVHQRFMRQAQEKTHTQPAATPQQRQPGKK